jgi:hypothetical protein
MKKKQNSKIVHFSDCSQLTHDLCFYVVFPILFTLFVTSTLLKFKRVMHLVSLIFSSKDVLLNYFIYMVYL